MNREAVDSLLEAKLLIERWRLRYNTFYPLSSLGYRPPALEAFTPWSPDLMGHEHTQ